MDFFQALLRALPGAATSIYGLFAYALTLIGWVVIAWRVQRNKELLKNLTKLPEQDRLSALEMEMGGVRLKEGISAEHWLKHQSHKYLMWGYAITVLAVIIVIIVTVFWKDTEPEVNLTLQEKSSRVFKHTPIVHDSTKNMMSEKEDESNYNINTNFKINANTDIYYEYEKSGNLLKIKPVFTYRDDLEAGGIASGLSYWWEPFSWELPTLSYKVVNNTSKTLLVSEIAVNVIKSSINLSPVLFVKRSNYYGVLPIFNDGWGDVVKPKLKLLLDQNEDSKSESNGQSNSFDITLDNFTDDTEVNLNRWIQVINATPSLFRVAF